jgi:hypothetical protein
VDSGNLLFKQATIAEGPSQERLTAEGIIKIYTSMKVDAVAVAPMDLAAGTELLLASQKQGFPWLSANLLDSKGQTLFEPARIKKIGAVKVGIIGLTGPLNAPLSGVRQADWRTLLPALIKKTARQCDILILLSSLSPAENQEIAREFSALHLILAAVLDSGNMNPTQVNNSLITQTDRQGKYQGVLTIDWHKNGKWGTSTNEDLSTLRNRLAALNWQLQRMQQQADPQQHEYLAKVRMIEMDRDSVARQIKTAEFKEMDTTNGKNSSPAISSFSFNFVALKQSLPEAPEIRAILTGIKQQIHDMNRKVSRKEENLPFLGHDGCAGCHPAQTAFWRGTSHSRAWETLQKANQAFNLECLPCHVISSSEMPVQRNQLLSLPKSLQTVGCENCHVGPGKAHAANPEQFHMKKQVEERICLSCHTPQHDNNFNYQEKMPRIACPPN